MENKRKRGLFSPSFLYHVDRAVCLSVHLSVLTHVLICTDMYEHKLKAIICFFLVQGGYLTFLASTTKETGVVWCLMVKLLACMHGMGDVSICERLGRKRKYHRDELLAKELRSTHIYIKYICTRKDL